MKAPDTLPRKMSLKPSKLKWAIMLLISLAFVACFAFLIPAGEDPVMRWGGLVFFLIAALASIPGLLGIGGLDLDSEGFTILTIGKQTRRTWRECSEFSVIWIRSTTFVGFSSQTDAKHAAAGLARTPVGETGMLPDRYGMSARALAELMNRFRARALQAR